MWAADRRDPDRCCQSCSCCPCRWWSRRCCCTRDRPLHSSGCLAHSTNSAECCCRHFAISLRCRRVSHSWKCSMVCWCCRCWRCAYPTLSDYCSWTFSCRQLTQTSMHSRRWSRWDPLVKFECHWRYFVTALAFGRTMMTRQRSAALLAVLTRVKSHFPPDETLKMMIYLSLDVREKKMDVAIKYICEYQTLL